ncbi:MAG: hypothetical protein CMA63_06575 [Euryarchaeota archaeon]|nr:hypothetical protein [Euryarchaeota archaeon]
MKRSSLMLFSATNSQMMKDPNLSSLLERASPEEVEAFGRALRSAYVAGQDDSDARTGKLMARIFGGFVGVTPGIDVNREDDSATPRERLKGIVSLLAGATRRGGG